jgi:hypothetical protein
MCLATAKSSRATRNYLELPLAAKAESLYDRSRGLARDPGLERAVTESIAWLGRAQDESTSKDDGVARHYSLVSGWGPSYPETTGYIIPTLIGVAETRQDEPLMQRARRMLDWLVRIQLPRGGFQGGTVNDKPVVPVTFNTGQILLGLASGAAKFGEPYLVSMHRAAEWLVSTQDAGGCWRKYPTPFAEVGEKAYQTHIAWGLFEAARVAPEKGYADAAIRNVRWALTNQAANGWFANCCLNDPSQPLTHTIGYVLRGVLEAYQYTKNLLLLDASRRAAEGLLGAIERNGFLPRLSGTASCQVDWTLDGIVRSHGPASQGVCRLLIAG